MLFSKQVIIQAISSNLSRSLRYETAIITELNFITFFFFFFLFAKLKQYPEKVIESISQTV